MRKYKFGNLIDQIRDCSLFMPKGGPVFRMGGGGGKFSKSMKKEWCFLKIQIRGGGKLLERFSFQPILKSKVDYILASNNRHSAFLSTFNYLFYFSPCQGWVNAKINCFRPRVE